MRSITKKIILSVLTSLVVFLTMFATTYAWVGIFTYSSTNSFDLNLKVEDLNNEYFLTISDTGERNSFGEEVSLDVIQKQIMTNLGISYDMINSSDPDAVNKFFSDKTKLAPVTPRLDSNKNINYFEEIYNLSSGPIGFSETNKYYKFDIYLSVDTKEGIQSNTNISASVALSDIGNSLVGTITPYILNNGNTILSNNFKPSDFDINRYPVLKDLPNVFSIDSSSSARFALEIYEPIDVDSTYTNETPLKTMIYQGGTKEPTLINDVYSLGGILPEEYNLSIQEMNKMFNRDLTIPEDIKNREELELIDDNRKIYLAEDYLEYCFGVKDGNQTKIKISVYFWFEGWDADCIIAIEKKNVSLSLAFTADIDE